VSARAHPIVPWTVGPGGATGAARVYIRSMRKAALSRFRDLRERIVLDASGEWGVRRAGLVDALVVMPFVGAVVVIATWANRP